MNRLSIDSYKDVIHNWIQKEKEWTCGSNAARKYLGESRMRYERVLDVCKKYKTSPSSRVLDVGQHYLTFFLSSYYSNVKTIGFSSDLSNESSSLNLEYDIDVSKAIDNIEFDLNKARNIESWPSDLKFDLIVYSEVIEHLYEAPEFTLLLFKHLLSDDGGVFIVATPNAISLIRRIRFLLGINVQERIRFYSQNPGHFREYTKKELIHMGEMAGFKDIYHEYNDYWLRNRVIFRWLEKLVVPSWKGSQIIVFSK